MDGMSKPKAAQQHEKTPAEMSRGEFEEWARIRGKGAYDVIRDRMMFRTSRAVFRVEMPVRFQTVFYDGIVYALVSDIEQYGKLM